MPEDDDQAEAADRFADAILRAWLKGRDFERVTRYVKRGRRYSQLSDEMLIETWVGNMKQYCRDPGEPQAHDIQLDLDAEIGLRGFDMPYQRVAGEFEVLHQHFIQRVEEMKKNGKEWDDFNDAMKQDLAEFLVAMQEESETPN
jgi:hypothetical protein